MKGNETQLFHVSDLKMAHEQQTKSLEEEFEKIRLSLQVTFFVKIPAFFNEHRHLTVDVTPTRIRWTR